MKRIYTFLIILTIAHSLSTFAQGFEPPVNINPPEKEEKEQIDSSSACSGCKAQEVNDWHTTTRPPNHMNIDVISLGTIEINDPSLSSCNRSGDFENKIIVELEASIYQEEEEESCSVISDCSAAKCKGDIEFKVKITDPTPDLFGDACLVRGSNLRIEYKHQNSSEKNEIISDLIRREINRQQSRQAIFGINLVEFETDCGGDTISIPLPIVNVKYTSEGGQEKRVPFLVYPIDIACSECNEDDANNANQKLNQHSKHSLNVYPNPANDQLNFTFTTPASESVPLLITNIYGQTIYHEIHSLSVGKNNVKIDVRNIPNGTYFYVYTVDGKPIQGKIILQH